MQCWVGGRREKGLVNVYDLGSLYHYLTTYRSHLALDLDNKKEGIFSENHWALFLLLLLRQTSHSPSSLHLNDLQSISQCLLVTYCEHRGKETVPVPNAHESGGHNVCVCMCVYIIIMRVIPVI